MNREYRRIVEQQKASEELIEETKKKMRQIQRRKKIKRYTTILASAACLGVVCIAGIQGVSKSSSGIYEKLEAEEIKKDEFETGILLGKGFLKDEKSYESAFHVMKYKNPEEVPEEVYKLKEQKVKGKQIRFGYYEKERMYCALCKIDGVYVYITGENITEEEMKKFLENNL